MVCSISNVIVWVLWITVFSTYGQTCKYGDGAPCQYACHCALDVICDPRTGCSNAQSPQSKCALGWDGNTCQRQNVALRRQARQSIRGCTGDSQCLEEDNAVDGRVGHNLYSTPCSFIPTGAVWSVTLDTTYSIYRFTVYNRGGGDCCGDRLNGFQLSIGRTSDPDSNYIPCYQDNTTSPQGPGNVVTRTCNQSIEGDLVQINKTYGSGLPLILCEVLIYVCAPGWYGEMCDVECMSEDKCITCTANQLACAACKEGKWGDDCNRTCNCWNNNACVKETGVCPSTDPYRCPAGFKVDAEGRCMEGCTAGFHGPDCGEMCGSCRDGNNTCAKNTGKCPDSVDTRCLDGYTGDLCKDECQPGAFGTNCSGKCGGCNGGPDKCATENGICPEISGVRCAAGYMGELCNTECLPGSYGVDCMDTCGSCAAGSVNCSTDYGVCPVILGSTRCSPGRQGQQCKENSTTSGPATEAIVGGSVAAVAAAMLVVIVIFFIIKRRRNPPKGLDQPGNELRPVYKSQPTFSLIVAPPNDAQRGRGGEYYNVPAFRAVHSEVPVDELEAYVRLKRAEDKLSAEYEGLPKGLQANCDVAKKAENKAKSRYQNIVAYDHSRVVLDPLDEDPHSDYINACYIHGYGEINKYVASQGPTGIIVNDFWRTIWQVNTGKVVMLTNLTENLKKKCELYWPLSVSDVSEFGLIRVTLFHEDAYADFTVRTLHVTSKKHLGQTKEIKQFHFTAWPDHGVPTHATGLLNFLDKVNSTKSKLRGPVFIHCSAGIGRTGTFIGLDYLINQSNEDGVVDVPGCVRLMREQRTNMIQTVGQYEFLYDALIEAIKLFNCSISSADFPSVYRDLGIVNPDTGQTKLQEQFKALNDLSPALTTADLTTATDPVNLPKSRNPTILAADSVRPFLSTPVSGCNNYINAVFLPAYKRKRAFIITQMPVPGTIIDFWRLIHEQDVRTVVMLNTAERDIGLYWPEKSAQYGPFGVETLEVENGDSFVIRNLNFQYKKEAEKDTANIKQFQSTFWKEDTMVPESSRSLITLIEEVERWQQQSGNGPIIVHCMDGASKSGLFCAISSIIERLKVDQEVKILQTLKQIRANRPEIVRNMEQFQFIHEVVLAYLDSFQTYANFQ